MTINNPIPAPNAKSQASWQARLDREAQMAAEYARTAGRPKLSTRLIAGMLHLTGLYARGVRNAAAIRVRRIQFQYPTLPQAFVGLRILHLTDTHFRRGASTEHLCSILRDIECDVCLMTGDFAYVARHKHDYIGETMREVTASIRAPQGIFGILGNHDHAADVARLRDAGITMLVNEGTAVSVNGATLWLAGVDDPHDFEAHDLAAALQGAPEDAFTILLAHSPEIVQQAADQGVNLYLCGHTHGGQLCLPWIGPVHLNARCERRVGHGEWVQGAMRGVTNAGIGATAVPVRYCCPPEVLVIELAKQ